jgi:S1-C subfamily serine protease
VPAGWLGIYGDSLAQIPDTERGAIGIDNKLGVIVREFLPNSPALTSGMLPNDVIIGIDGFEIAGSTDLSAVLSSMPAGHKARLRVIRSRRNVEVNVELGAKEYTPLAIDLGDIVRRKESPAAQIDEIGARLAELSAQYKSYLARKDVSARERQEALRELGIEIRQLQDRLRELQQQGAGQEQISADHNSNEPGSSTSGDAAFKAGFVLRELTPQLAGFFGAEAGMLVVSVLKGSPAERSGLKTGDVIVGLSDQETPTPLHLREMLSTQNGEIKLKIVRAKNPLVITLASQ